MTTYYPYSEERTVLGRTVHVTHRNRDNMTVCVARTTYKVELDRDMHPWVSYAFRDGKIVSEGRHLEDLLENVVRKQFRIK